MKLVEDCKDLFGTLSEHHQEVLNRLLQEPNAEDWEIARRIVVSPAPLLTLDMAVKRVSDMRIMACPDPFTIYRALDYSVKKHQLYLKRPVDVEFGIL